MCWFKSISLQNRLLLVEVKNAMIRIVFIAKSTSTSRSEKCVDSNRFRCKILYAEALQYLHGHHSDVLRTKLERTQMLTRWSHTLPLGLSIYRSIARVLGKGTRRWPMALGPSLTKYHIMRNMSRHTWRESNQQTMLIGHLSTLLVGLTLLQCLRICVEHVFVWYIKCAVIFAKTASIPMQNRLLLVEVKNELIQIDSDAKSTSTSRSEKCVDSNRFRCKIDFY